MGLILPPKYAAMQREAMKQQVAREISKRISADIQRHYPEHLFKVTCDPKDGNIYIDHPLLAHSKSRYFIKAGTDDPDKLAVKFAGEVLERANVVRGELRYFDQYDGEAERLSKTQFNAR